jgi:hypothetical protein
VGGNGVYLSNTRDVSLTRMRIANHPNHAIRGSNVTNFTLANSQVTGVNGNNGSIDEASVSFTGLLGSASIASSFVDGGIEDNVRVTNSSGTLNRLTVSASTIGLNDPGNSSNDGLFVQGVGNATVNTTVTGSRFTGAGGDLFNYDLGGTAAGDLQASGNLFANGHPNTAAGGGGVTVSAGGGGTPTLTYGISGNTWRGALGSALVVNKTSGAGNASGTITNNTIGATATASSGSAQGSGMNVEIVGGGSHQTTITGNQVRQFGNYGIYLAAGNNSPANGGRGRLNAVVNGNTIATPAPFAAFPTSGVHLNSGTNSGDDAIVCLTLGAAGAPNTIAGTGTNGATDFRLRERMNTTVALPGYVGANDDNAAVVAYVQSRNAGAPTGSAANAVSTGGPGFVGTCPP